MDLDSELFSMDEEMGPVTSVSWAPNGQHIAVGMNNSIVELWDMTSNQKAHALNFSNYMNLIVLR